MKPKRELPKNPNIRQPYSDVSGDLESNFSSVVEFLGYSRKEMGEADWSNLMSYIERMDQSILRARAVLDPESLEDADWEKALIPPEDARFGDTDAFDTGSGMIHGSSLVKGLGKKKWWRFW